MFTTLTTTAGLAQTGGPGPWDGDGPAFWPIFPLLWFALLAAVAVTVVVLARRSRATAPRRCGEARLAELFAAGDITEQEFRERRTVLREKD